MDAKEALAELHALVAILVGRGPDAIIPDAIRTPLGVYVKIGDIMQRAAAALASPAPAAAGKRCTNHHWTCTNRPPEGCPECKPAPAAAEGDGLADLENIYTIPKPVGDHIKQLGKWLAAERARATAAESRIAELERALVEIDKELDACESGTVAECLAKYRAVRNFQPGKRRLAIIRAAALPKADKETDK